MSLADLQTASVDDATEQWLAKATDTNPPYPKIFISIFGASKVPSTPVPKTSTLWNPADPMLPAYKQIAGQNLPPCSKGDYSTYGYIVACLITRQYLYWHFAPGDCGGAFSISGPSSAVPGFISLGSQTGQLGASLAQKAGADVGTLGSNIPIVGSFLSIATSLSGYIERHHQQAVAKEQQVNCGVKQFTDQFWNQVAQAVASGQMPASDAARALDAAQKQIESALDGVASGCNWGEVGIYATRALTQLLKTLLTNTQSLPVAASASSSAGGTGTGIIVAAGAVAAHAAGAF